MNDEILQELGSLADAGDEASWLRAAETIRRTGGYRWVGLNDVTQREIAALAWTGSDAPACPRFSREKGLNGAAVIAKQPVIVQDVSSDPRYLTAFATTGSEAIFPILARLERSSARSTLKAIDATRFHRAMSVSGAPAR